MPNHVDNELIIKGPKEELTRFAEHAKARPDAKKHKTLGDKIKEKLNPEEEQIDLLDVNQFIPYPQKFKEQDERSHKANEEWQEKRKALVKNGASEEELTVAWQPYRDIKDGYNDGGYEWCVQNWGTKWGMYDTCLTVKPRSLIYNFNTAWSPPEPIIMKMSEMFPRLTFRLQYWEGGGGFQGKRVYEQGECFDEWNGDYSGPRGG